MTVTFRRPRSNGKVADPEHRVDDLQDHGHRHVRSGPTVTGTASPTTIDNCPSVANADQADADARRRRRPLRPQRVRARRAPRRGPEPGDRPRGFAALRRRLLLGRGRHGSRAHQGERAWRPHRQWRRHLVLVADSGRRRSAATSRSRPTTARTRATDSFAWSAFNVSSDRRHLQRRADRRGRIGDGVADERRSTRRRKTRPPGSTTRSAARTTRSRRPTRTPARTTRSCARSPTTAPTRCPLASSTRTTATPTTTPRSWCATSRRRSRAPRSRADRASRASRATRSALGFAWTDPAGSHDTYSYDVDWGDGSAHATGSGQALR